MVDEVRRTKPRVLVIDDGDRYARLVATHLAEVDLVAPAPGTPGETPELCVHDGPTALEFLGEQADQIDLVLLDLHFDLPAARLLPGPGSLKQRQRTQGLAILRELRVRHPELPVILLSSVDDVSLLTNPAEVAAQGMTYFLADDVADLESLRVRIAAVLAERPAAEQTGRFFWGRDAAIRSLRARLTVLARGALPILIQGETGTGKSLVAREFVHAASGRRGPFVTLDLATVPPTLAASELFGVVKGAYTGAVADRKGVFEQASGGTLFLDEIGNATPELQRQLLVVLEEGILRPVGGGRERQVDVKLVAATNEPLERAVAEGRFRADLYMRLNPTTRVVLPPLRERSPRDREALAQSFAERALDAADPRALYERVSQALAHDGEPLPLALRFSRAVRDFDGIQVVIPRPAVRLLHEHPWPGNLRELSMVVQNLITFTLVQVVEAIDAGRPPRERRLQVDATLVRDLLRTVQVGAEATGTGDPLRSVTVSLDPGESLHAVAAAVERQYFTQLFRELDGDFARMAEVLLDDPERARSVRLRFNQLGLKVRQLKK